MKQLLILVVFGLGIAESRAQVCCAPVGGVQAGGGATLLTSVVHWPNRIFMDERWHWTTAGAAMAPRAAGNIKYGPTINVRAELARTTRFNQVAYLATSGSVGSLEEEVTYNMSNSSYWAGRLSLGVRLAPRKLMHTLIQFSVEVPTETRYSEDAFPFEASVPPRLELLIINSQSMPWLQQRPDLFSSVNFNLSYGKNLGVATSTLQDHQLLLHASSGFQVLFPLLLVPFVQLQVEQFLAPPSIWTDNRQERWLAAAMVGTDLAIGRQAWDRLQLRVAVPVWSFASRGGFPDGSQPTAQLSLGINWGGFIAGE